MRPFPQTRESFTLSSSVFGCRSRSDLQTKTSDGTEVGDGPDPVLQCDPPPPCLSKKLFPLV